MSDLRVNNLKARTDGNVPTIVGGAVISGITTISGVLEAESGITAENVSATGIATISTAIVGTAVTINSSGAVVTGVITATSFSGSGEGLTGVASTDFIITGTAATFNNTTQLQNVQLVGVTTGLNVSGVATFASSVTATSFEGSGANLTGLPAGFTELDAALFN